MAFWTLKVAFFPLDEREIAFETPVIDRKTIQNKEDTMESAAEKTTETKPWAVKRAVNEALRERELPDLDEEEELNEDEEREIESGIPQDVFDHCHGLIERQGEVVSYEIQRNSQFVAKKAHPYSWDKLQAEFGEGHYRVIARSERTKRYIKQETKFVSASQEPAQRESVADAVRAAMPPKEDPFEQVAKMATLLKSLTPTPPPPPEDKSSGLMIQFMQTMMQMQQAAQTSTLTMITEMQKSNQALIEKLDKSQKETLDKLEAKLASGGGKDKLDAITLLKLVQDAEKRGQDNMLRLEELAEKKAARLNRSDDEDKEPETMTDKLIKTVLPSVAASLTAPRQAAPQAPQVVNRPIPRAPVPAAPQMRRSTAPVPTNAIPVPKRPAPTKEQMLNLIMPSLGMKLIGADQIKEDKEKLAQSHKDAAMETRALLGEKGIPLKHLLDSVSRDDMLGIAKAAGLPDEANPWLTEYYAHLQQLAAPSAKENGNPQNP